MRVKGLKLRLTGAKIMDYRLDGLIQGMEKLGCKFIKFGIKGNNKTIKFKAPISFNEGMEERAARPFKEWFDLKLEIDRGVK